MQLLCPARHCDMSGTVILTSHPVAVLMGSEFNQISNNYDMLLEQALPLHRPQGLSGGSQENSLNNYTYVLVPLVEGETTEEVVVVVDDAGTNLSLSTGETFTSQEAGEVSQSKTERSDNNM